MKAQRITGKINGLGFVAYWKLRESEKQELLTIVFTKGKLELETNTIERINVYDESMNIIFKDKTTKYINLHNVTYME